MIRRLFGLIFLLVCGTSLSHAAAVSFLARQDIATSAQHLTGLAVADFNGDGKPDIAVTDDYSQVLTVYLNDGSGHFSKSVTTTLNVPGIGGLGALVAGDVNEDGKQDLIIGPIAGLQYDIVLLGNGDGTFTEKGQITTSYGFGSAALIDINGDKHLDLITGGNGSLAVNLGDGKGNFTGGFLNGPSGLFNGLTVGDFNGDKQIDFVASDYINSQLLVFTGNGDGTFKKDGTITNSSTTIVTHPGSIVSADFNGDGKLDLLSAGVDYAVIFLGNGDGTFQTDSYKNPSFVLPPGSATSQTSSPLLATADMDGNGTPDIVAADDNAQLVSVFLNDGKANFALPGPDYDAQIDPGTAAMQVADVNGDGLPDIILINYKTGKISIFLSQTPTPTLTIQSSALQSLVGTSPTLTVQVNSTGSTVPTGTVTVSSGTASFGQQTLDSKASVTFTLANLTAGQYPLKIAYSGDKYNQPVIYNTITQAITDFQASLASSAESVGVGAAATYAVTLTPEYGFNGSVALTCSGLPAGYTCAAVTSNVSGTGTTTNFVVSPPSQTAVRTGRESNPFGPPALASYAVLALCLLVPRRRKLPSLVLFTLCFVAAGSLSGCSSSGPAAYTGTSNFIITATATQGSQTVSHQVTATLTVH